MRLRSAFAATLAGSLLLVGNARAQDAIVSVRRDRVGADLVDVTVRKRTYPAELLRRQLLDLGLRLGHGGARGVAVFAENFHPGDPTAVLLKGSCGVDGLIDRTTGSLDVVPIAQAFAGAPEPYTIRRILVSFDGEVPGPKTLARHTSGKGSDLAFVARPIGSSVEYDVELRSQDPTRLVVNGVSSNVKPVAAPTKGIDPLTTVLFALAVLAAGALVYCLLLLIGRRPSYKS